MVKKKFKAAYLSSSLFSEIDREQLYTEQKHVWDHAQFEHYRYFSAKSNFNGKYISTNKNGYRTTVQYLKEEKLPLKYIAIFGTSTMWGGPSGGDQFTVPSQLSKKLNETVKDINFVVKNFSVGAYTSTQELILFIELLEQETIDFAIFVDGASEFLKSYDELIGNNPRQGFLQPDIKYFQYGVLNSGLLPQYVSYFLRFKKSVIGKFLRKLKDRYMVTKRYHVNHQNTKSESLNNDEQINRTLSLYLKNKKIIEAIADRYSIKTFFVLEPWIYTKSNLSDEERIILEKCTKNKVMSTHITDCIKAFSMSFSKMDNSFDFTTLMNIDQTIYIDEHHMSKEGNEIIADRISQIILSYLPNS